MAAIDFKPENAQRGIFFSDLLCFAKTTQLEAAAYLLCNRRIPSLHSSLVFHAAVNTVLEGLLERLVLPCLDNSSAYAVDVANIKHFDFDNPPTGGDLPAFIKPSQELGEVLERNPATFTRYLSLARWQALLRDTFDFAQTVNVWESSSDIKIYAPCVPEEVADTATMTQQKKYTTTQWDTAIDLSEGQPTCAREMYGLADKVAEGLRDLLVSLGMGVDRVTLPVGLLTLFKAGGAVRTAFPAWDALPLIGVLPNGENATEIPPTYIRSSLDLLWACQAVLGHMETTYSTIPTELLFLHEDTTLEQVTEIYPGLEPIVGNAVTTVETYPRDPANEPCPQELIYQRGTAEAHGEMVIDNNPDLQILGGVLWAPADDPIFDICWYPVRPNGDGARAITLPSREWLVQNMQILTGVHHSYYQTPIQCYCHQRITQTATLRKPKSLYGATFDSRYPSTILEGAGYFEKCKTLLAAKRQPYNATSDFYRLIRGDEVKASDSLAQAALNFMNEENTRMSGFALPQLPSLAGVTFHVKWDQDWLDHYETLTEGTVEIWADGIHGAPCPARIYYDDMKNLFILTSDLIRQDGSRLREGDPKPTENELAENPVVGYENKRIYMVNMYWEDTTTGEKTVWTPHMFDIEVSGYPSATQETETITPANKAMLGIDWAWKSLPATKK